MSYSELLFRLIPEACVTVTALVILGVDVAVMRERPARTRLWLGALITTLGCLVAGGWLLGSSETGRFYGGILVLDDLGRLMKLAILFLTLLTAWLTTDSEHFTDHVGEYFTLLLLATVGMMLLVSTEHLLMIFVSLELLSLALYIMTAFDKRSIQSAEAALKYFLFGGMSAAFLLFGLSLVYGVSGELELSRMAPAISQTNVDPLLIIAVVMIVIGFGFKVAAVPFHLWAPDTYQGAPLPSAAFIASGSKVASFFILARVMMVGFDGMPGKGGYGDLVAGWVPILVVVAALSVILGNLAALAQTSVRRLLAYSAIAQAGYVLVGLSADTAQGLASVLFYVITYALTALGAFAVVGWVQTRTGREDFAAFAGLRQRAPVMSVCMLIFLLSLAGIPPLAGFFGKFFLFKAALGRDGGAQLGLLWLVLLAVAMSAVSLYYYLKILKQIFVVETTSLTWPASKSSVVPLMVVVLAVLVVLFGCLPGLLVDVLLPALRAFEAAGI